METSVLCVSLYVRTGRNWVFPKNLVVIIQSWFARLWWSSVTGRIVLQWTVISEMMHLSHHFRSILCHNDAILHEICSHAFFTSQSQYSWLQLCIHAHLCTGVAATDLQTAIIKNGLSFSLSSPYKNAISTVHLHLSLWMRRKREGSPGSSIIISGKELCFQFWHFICPQAIRQSFFLKLKRIRFIREEFIRQLYLIKAVPVFPPADLESGKLVNRVKCLSIKGDCFTTELALSISQHQSFWLSPQFTSSSVGDTRMEEAHLLFLGSCLL